MVLHQAELRLLLGLLVQIVTTVRCLTLTELLPLLRQVYLTTQLLVAAAEAAVEKVQQAFLQVAVVQVEDIAQVLHIWLLVLMQFKLVLVLLESVVAQLL
jgi:hypothetical protein